MSVQPSLVDLRELLLQPPSREVWQHLMIMLEQLEESEQEVAGAYIQEHTSAWPHDIKLVPASALHGRYHMVSGVALSDEDLDLLDLADLAQLKTLTYLDLSDCPRLFLHSDQETIQATFRALIQSRWSFYVVSWCPEVQQLVGHESTGAPGLVLTLPPTVVDVACDKSDCCLLFADGSLCHFTAEHVRLLHTQAKAAEGERLCMPPSAELLFRGYQTSGEFNYPEGFYSSLGMAQFPEQGHTISWSTPPEEDFFEAIGGLAVSPDGHYLAWNYITEQPTNEWGSCGDRVSGYEVYRHDNNQRVFHERDSRSHDDYDPYELFVGPGGEPLVVCRKEVLSSSQVEPSWSIFDLEFYWSDSSEGIGAAPPQETDAERRCFCPDFGEYTESFHCTFSPDGQIVGLYNQEGIAWLVQRLSSDQASFCRLKERVLSLNLSHNGTIHIINQERKLNIVTASELSWKSIRAL